jgi:hypothetical protein
VIGVTSRAVVSQEQLIDLQNARGGGRQFYNEGYSATPEEAMAAFQS